MILAQRSVHLLYFSGKTLYVKLAVHNAQLHKAELHNAVALFSLQTAWVQVTSAESWEA